MKLSRVIVVVFIGCGTNHEVAPEVDASTVGATLTESRLTAARIDAIRSRFVVAGRPVIDRGVAQFTATTDGTYLEAATAAQGVRRAAHVALPVRCDQPVKLEDLRSRTAVSFALKSAESAHVEVSDGLALYRGAIDGADVVHRVDPVGTEDYVLFETAPKAESLDYLVNVSQVAGLRLVSSTLEFVDATGSPALRITPPYVIDAHGASQPASLTVLDCAYDNDPSAPWGRAITPPGSSRCTVRVSWSHVVYPALVDPKWTTTGALVTGRYYQSAVSLTSGKALVLGGIGLSSTFLASAELFDETANNNVGAFAATGSMGVARDSAIVTRLASGKVLVAGGASAPGVFLSSAEIYDPSVGTFAATGSMSTARVQHAATLLSSGKVLVSGANQTNGTNVVLASAELFDPSGNSGVGTFSATGSMATARGFHTSSLLPSGKVLVVGGVGALNTLASAEIFDPAGNSGVGSFSATGSLSVERTYQTATVLSNGKVLVAGGQSQFTSYLKTAELFDPAANNGVGAFAATGSMTDGRQQHAAVLLPSGKALVIAGNPASSELFDPTANSNVGAFTPSAFLNSSHNSAPTANLLPSGRVLIVGGIGSSSAELYGGVLADPCTDARYCFSGFCSDGYCCDALCNLACDRCDIAVGHCSPSPASDPGSNPSCSPFACDGVNASCPTVCTTDAQCTTGYYCATNGACQPRKAQGSACNAMSECASHFCVDGFCCDKACDGACEACAGSLKYASGPDGTCDTAKGGLPRGDGGVLCGPPGATCDGDHTTVSPDGGTSDCSPYKCDSTGSCRSSCNSVNDCVAPNVCDTTGKCTSIGGGGGGGCAVTPSTRAATLLEYGYGLALLIVLRHRRAPCARAD